MINMQAALQRRIQRYGWDKASSFYEPSWVEQLMPAHNALLTKIRLEPGEKVLDIACGSGQLTFPAAKMVGKSGQVVGTDISDKMIEMAKAKALDRSQSNVDFIRMGADKLDFEDASFDTVICSLGLMYFPEPLRALDEMLRVLKPGGKLGITVWGKRVNCGWAGVFEIVDRRVVTEVCPLFFQFGYPENLAKLIERSGFQAVQTQVINSVLKYQDEEEASQAAFAGGPVALAYFKFTEEIKEAVHQEYKDSIKAHKTTIGYELPGEFVIATSRKS